MNKRLDLSLRIEYSQRPRVCEIRIFDAQYRYLPVCPGVFTQIDCGRAGAINSWRVTRIRKECHVSFAGFIKSRCANDIQVVSCALDTRASQFRQF